MNELLLLVEAWSSRHRWQRLNRAWVAALKADHVAFVERATNTKHFGNSYRQIDWQGQRRGLTEELLKIDALVRLHRPVLLGDVYLPDLDPCADPIPTSDAPAFAQRMKGLLGKLSEKSEPKRKTKKLGRPQTQFSKTIVPFITSLRAEKLKWQVVTNRVNERFGTKYEMKNLQRQYQRVSSECKSTA